MRRREVILGGLSLPVAALASGGLLAPRVFALGRTQAAFDDDTVPALARQLAAAPFHKPVVELPPWLHDMGYDAYRGIRFNPTRALWREQGLPFQAQFFHRGFLFKDRVRVFTVADGRASEVAYSPKLFNFPAGTQPGRTANDLGFAGFRLHGRLNRADYFDEICAFLGASYFRAVAKGQAYGLSARGLALDTLQPQGEEFPVFRSFWLETPAADADAVVVHALMDSPSVSGAFRFAIHPGVDHSNDETRFDVQARLYPRVELAHAGIAALTSMYSFGASDRAGVDDYRPAVHDSDGLALWTGAGEQIWRPLQNPSRVQDSGFEDSNPRGFGLMQRQRDFADYADDEAHYQRRPSLWVEPVGDWGKGSVHLIELPTGDEYHDNIVAFWRPAAPLAAGREHRFDYRLHWCNAHTWNPALASVADTRIGAVPKTGARRVVIDFEGDALKGLSAESGIKADVWSNTGKVLNPVAHALTTTDGWRIGFELEPGNATAVELHARLTKDTQPLSETWLYRWTP